jgi:hypothetical protein
MNLIGSPSPSFKASFFRLVSNVFKDVASWSDMSTIRVKVKDGKIESEDSKGLIGHVSVPIGKWMINVPYA